MMMSNNMNDPNTLQEEKTIIACFVDNPEITYEICDKYGLQPADFSTYKPYFASVSTLYRTNNIVDKQSLAEYLYNTYREELDENVLSSVDFRNLEGYCRRLKMKSTKQAITASLNELLNNVSEVSLSDSLHDLYTPVINTYNSVIDLIRDPNDSAIQLGSLTDDILEYFEEGDDSIISTGFPRYDKMIGGGLRLSSMHMIEARPGVGKSFFSLNVAYNIACNNIPVLLLDTELDYRFLTTRLLSLMSGIPITIIEDKSTWRKDDELSRYLKFVLKEVLPLFPIHYRYIGGLPLNHVLNICKTFVQQFKDIVPVVVYDYILVTDSNELKNSNLNETQILGTIMNQLHDLTVRYSFPMLFLCQTNREHKNKAGSGSTAASDRFEWKASSKGNLMTPQDDTPNRLELYITKSRFGIVSSTPIIFKKNFAIASLEETDSY